MRGAKAPTHEGTVGRRSRLASSQRMKPRAPRGFTLIELMVAVVVLLVVILVTSRVFTTVQQVTGMGQASVAILQEASTIERRLREDISRLSTDGFFVIRQVAVPNNVHGPDEPLLNPLLPFDAWIRSDHMLFFADGVQSIQTARIGYGINIRGQGAATRMYWGHGFQMPGGQAADVPADNLAFTMDPGAQVAAMEPFVPWRRGPMRVVRTRFEQAANPATTTVFSRTVPNPNQVDGTQPEPWSWLLVRQPAALVDDDQQIGQANAKTVYLQEIVTARSIFCDEFGSDPGVQHQAGWGWTRELRNGRVDGAATRLDDIRRWVEFGLPGMGFPPRSFNNPTEGQSFLPYLGDQRNIKSTALYYPRAERFAPSMHRVDQALTNHVIGSGVSSIIIEWTWDSGVGDVVNSDGEFERYWYDVGPGDWYYLRGFHTGCTDMDGDPCHTDEWQREQPWFGMNLFGEPDPDPQLLTRDRGVGFLGLEDPFQPNNDRYWRRANYTHSHPDFLQYEDWRVGTTIFAGPDNATNNIERYFGPGDMAIRPPWLQWPGTHVYEATFGFNRNTPVAPNPDSAVAPFNVEPFLQLGYTPWPTAIRVTVIVHDPANRMEHGREFQFVIDLPRRVR